MRNSVQPIRRFMLAVLVLLALHPPAPRKTGFAPAPGLAWKKCALPFPTLCPRRPDSKNAELLKTFNDTLWNDLDNAGIFDLVSKSFYPLQVPGQPPSQFCRLESAAANAAMLAFGNLGAAAGK